MTNRREFLHLGVAALALPLAAREVASPGIFGAEEPNSESLYGIIFDERFPACARFADEMMRRGVSKHAIRGDVTSIWFGDLYHRWKERPEAVAGMTAPGPIFCLGLLARDAGMRVALRVDHRYIGDNRIEHEFSGPREVLERATVLQASSGRWPERMAELVARFPVSRGSAAQECFSGASARGRNDPEHLVTWVIAPMRRG